ncbi:hypothetical protein BBSC_1717 [Bifidobacterium scardovii JCM 12489 = DSM 13734]|nr:hypothetical protein BBSC_1717 [Bifidobacterium scardovii JCM 12489 = DSM 13734]
MIVERGSLGAEATRFACSSRSSRSFVQPVVLTITRVRRVMQPVVLHLRVARDSADSAVPGDGDAHRDHGPRHARGPAPDGPPWGVH